MNLTPQVSELSGVDVIYPGKVHNPFRNCSRKDRKDRYPPFYEKSVFDTPGSMTVDDFSTARANSDVHPRDGSRSSRSC